MKHFIKNIMAVMLVFILSGCSVFIRDCTKKSHDPEAYRAYRACLAGQGNHQAQYELGLRAFEEQDYKTAVKWLTLAAAPSNGRTAAYMPPVGGQKYGTVMMMDSGQATAGHPAAQRLLAKIYDHGLGVKIDHDRAILYREMATKTPVPRR